MPVELSHLSWLIGEWEGVGLGQYPTIEDFRFGQRISITCDGRPFLTYGSRSWLLDEDGEFVRPLAGESGFLRPRPKNGVEVLLAHHTGYAEVWLGSVVVTAMDGGQVSGAKLELSTDVVARTDSAKQYSAGSRLYGLVDAELLWTFDMAAMGHPMSNHLAARLVQLDADAATD